MTDSLDGSGPYPTCKEEATAAGSWEKARSGAQAAATLATGPRSEKPEVILSIEWPTETQHGIYRFLGDPAPWNLWAFARAVPSARNILHPGLPNGLCPSSRKLC